MATFRIHLSTDSGVNAVANLITGIAEVRDELGAQVANDLLGHLETEIEFVRRYIIEQKRSFEDSVVVRADALLDSVLTSSARTTVTDIRSKATGTAIHP